MVETLPGIQVGNGFQQMPGIGLAAQKELSLSAASPSGKP